MIRVAIDRRPSRARGRPARRPRRRARHRRRRRARGDEAELGRCCTAPSPTSCCSTTTSRAATASSSAAASSRASRRRRCSSSRPTRTPGSAFAARRRGRRRDRRQGAPGARALRARSAASRAASACCRPVVREQLHEARAHASTTRTCRCCRCSRRHRAARDRRHAAHSPERARGRTDRVLARLRVEVPAPAGERPPQLAHAPRPHGHRAHRPRRARVRHLLAAAQRAHHLPRHARSTTRSPTSSSPSCCTWSRQDPDKDISIYINSPGGSIYAGLAIYDTMNFVKPDVATMCVRHRDVHGLAAADGRRDGQALRRCPTRGSSSTSPRRASRASRPTSRSTPARSSRRASASTRSTRTTRASREEQVHTDMERDRFFNADAGRRVRPDRPRPQLALTAAGGQARHRRGARSRRGPRSRCARRRRRRGTAAGPSPCRRRSACR